MTERAAPPQIALVDAAADSAQPLAAPAARAQAVARDAAFVALYRAHFEYVWRSLRRLGIKEADLPDLTHDVFVVVHRKLDDFDPARPAKPWLFGICFRTALDKKRKHASFRESSVGDAIDRAPRDAFAPPARAADDMVAAREAHDVVTRALDALDFDKRVVFVLHELDGLSMPEIAAIVDAPLNTLYSRLRLARDAFVDAVRRIQGNAP